MHWVLNQPVLFYFMYQVYVKLFLSPSMRRRYFYTFFSFNYIKLFQVKKKNQCRAKVLKKLNRLSNNWLSIRIKFRISICIFFYVILTDYFPFWQKKKSFFFSIWWFDHYLISSVIWFNLEQEKSFVLH